MNNKKLVLCAALYVFAAVDCWLNHEVVLGSASASDGLLALFSPLSLLRCALMALALWLAASVESALQTSRKGLVRLVLFASLAFALFYGYFFLLPILLVAALQLFAIALIFFILLADKLH